MPPRTAPGTARTARQRTPAAAKPTNGKGELGRPALTDLLLGLVEDRTGYPRDMLGMDQSLEADLGIDSIKRVEIVGALLKALPGGCPVRGVVARRSSQWPEDLERHR